MINKVIAGITKDLTVLPKKLKVEWKKANKKKLILMNLPYVLAAYFGNKLAWVYRTGRGGNASDKMINSMNGIETMFHNPFPSFQIRDVLVGIACGVVLFIVIFHKKKNGYKC